jgi:hypothetical protein
MNTRVLILIAGAVLLVAGVIGLLVPVSAASGTDGKSVGCGSALMSDLSEAQAADNNLSNTGADLTKKVAPSLAPAIPGQTNYVAACNSALSGRRAWTIPLAVVGLIVAGGSFLVRGRGARSALG